MQHVFRDKPEDFNRETGALRACPSCHGFEPAGMTENERLHLRAIARIQQPLVAEIERLAATDADLNGLSFRLEIADPLKFAEYLQSLAERARLHFERSKTSPCKD